MPFFRSTHQPCHYHSASLIVGSPQLPQYSSTRTVARRQEMSWKAVSEILKPASGHIILFFTGAVVGVALFSRNFTMQKRDFLFSTNEDKVSLAKLRDTYALRVKNLQVWSFC